MTNRTLDDEIRYYNEHRLAWIQAGRGGKYVVICGGEVVGFYDDVTAAARAAEAHCLGRTFLLRMVEPTDPIQIIKRTSLAAHG